MARKIIRLPDEPPAPKKKASKKRSRNKKAARSRPRGELSASEKRAADRRRATVVEMFDEDDELSGVAQAYRGTQFWRRLARPIFACELGERGRELDEQLIEDIGRMMSEGLPIYSCEALLGCSEKAVSNWCQGGKADARKIAEWNEIALEHGNTGAEARLGPKPEVTLRMKLDAVVRAGESVGEATLMGHITRSILDGNAESARWMLERRFPHRWGRMAMRTDLRKDNDGNSTRNPIGELADALAAVAERLET